MRMPPSHTHLSTGQLPHLLQEAWGSVPVDFTSLKEETSLTAEPNHWDSLGGGCEGQSLTVSP